MPFTKDSREIGVEIELGGVFRVVASDAGLGADFAMDSAEHIADESRIGGVQ